MKIKLALLCLLAAFFLCACGSGADKLEKENIEIARSYRTMYRAAEKGEAMNVGLSDDTVGAIVASLAESGYAVTDSSSVSGIRGSEQIKSFCSGETESVPLFIVCPDGGFIRYDLDRSGFCTVSRIYWNASKPEQTYAENFTVSDFELTDGGYFTFDAPGERVFLRMEPQDEYLASLCRTYISPIGYTGTNLFSTDWSKDDLSRPDLNALFGTLWLSMEQNGPGAFEADDSGMTAYVSAEVFESTLMQHLAVSGQAIRENARYDEEKNAYPVHFLSESDYLLFGISPFAEVRNAVENADGSLTLEVHAVSPELGTDSAFIHETTVMPQSGGGFRYVSNRIIHMEGETLPEYIDMLELTGAA